MGDYPSIDDGGTLRLGGESSESVPLKDVAEVQVHDISGDEIDARVVRLLLADGRRVRVKDVRPESAVEFLASLRRHNPKILFRNTREQLGVDGEPELQGASGVVVAAYCVALTETLIGALALAGAAVWVYLHPPRFLAALPTLVAASALVAVGAGFIKGFDVCRILLSGLSVLITLACAVLIYRGVALEGLASLRLLLTVPLVAGGVGAVAFIHPDVRAWCLRRRDHRPA